MSKFQETNFVRFTTEVEYISAFHACKETIWLKGFFSEFRRMQDNVTVFCDSQSAIHLDINPSYFSRSEHIDIRYHFVR